MPNPYGIEQVDIPGVYGAVQTARMGRIQQMLGERQIQAADRQAERDNGIRAIYARYAAQGTPGSTPSSGSSPAPTSSSTPNPVVAAYGGLPGPAQPAVTPPGLPGANPAGSPPAPGYSRQQMVGDVAVLDPEQAAHLQTLFSSMDESQHQAFARANNAIGTEAQFMLAHVPEEQWAAELHNVAPRLIAQGVAQDQIQPFLTGARPLTRMDLERFAAQAREIENIRKDNEPHPMVAPQGSTVIDTDSIDPVTNRPRILYESPVVNGPNGEPYARPQSMSQTQQVPPQPGEVRQTSRGPMRFRGGDYRNPANYDPVQGGAAQPNAPGTFPRQDGGAFDFNQHPSP